MRKLIASTVLALVCAGCATPIPSHAAERVTLTIDVTGVPSDADTLAINGDTRTWKTTVVTPSTQVTPGATAATSKDNLFDHIAAYGFSGPLILIDVDADTFRLIGAVDQSITSSIGGAWATLTLSTNTVTTLRGVRVPISGEPTASVRETIANDLISGIEDYATAGFATGTTALANYADLSTAQTFSGAKTLMSPLLSSPISTNLVNHGNAISSPGAGTSSEKFGEGALAGGDFGTAVGKSSRATGDYSSAFGISSLATGDYSVALGGSGVSGLHAIGIGATSLSTGEDALAIGYNSEASAADAIAIGDSAESTAADALTIGTSAAASAERAMAIGNSSIANKQDAIAIGYQSISTNINSIAIGSGAQTFSDDEIVLGDASHTTRVAGDIIIDGLMIAPVMGGMEARTLATIDADMLFLKQDHSSLANGANAAVDFSGNVFNRITAGPTGAFTIAGIAGGTNGRYLIVYNNTSQAMTIANDSGLDPTSANRILTMTGADVTSTGIATATLIYDASASKWLLIGWQD